MQTPKQKEPEAKLAETCTVCDRVRWGDFQVLPKPERAESRPWRHRECYAGSHSWLEIQRLKPESKRSPLYQYFANK